VAVTPRPRRLNDMQWCHNCKHGHAAHHNGFGKCFGEYMKAGEWFSCQCQAFTRAEHTPQQDT
jgi:hypothetical protein